MVHTSSNSMFVILTFIALLACNKALVKAIPPRNEILVAGSLNLDTFLHLQRLPTEGENLTLLPDTFPKVDVPGGKGCNQAIACAKLSSSSSSDTTTVTTTTTFLGQFGNDEQASILKSALVENGVNINYCGESDVPSGRGYVFVEKGSGKVSAVVSGGSNLYGWEKWKHEEDKSNILHKHFLGPIFDGKEKHENSNIKCVLLQMEIPEFVNMILAKCAKEHGVMVIKDVGGEDRPISPDMLSLCDYLIPNLSELKRLVKNFDAKLEEVSTTSNDVDQNYIIACARLLQKHGANNVLVTLGEKGSILISKNGGKVILQEACTIPDGCDVVDETGAGDCYRAGFAVALSEGKKTLKECMQFASGAGALAVTKEGAVPSIPTRKEVEKLIKDMEQKKESIKSNSANSLPRGGGDASDPEDESLDTETFPYMFGSRLNSMKDRPELWAKPVDNVREWVKRQGTIKGLGCVDFNYPQHFHTWTSQEAKAALSEAGLVAGAVCLRYPSKFARGAMNHPDEKLRREAIDITKQAAIVAKELGCNEVVVWSAFDGYDYPFQVNYKDKWKQIVAAFRECCDEFPDIKWSLEFKPTDENTRFFTVPSTGAAMLLVNEIDRQNMGLTLDVGHMLMAGENPGQSISMIGEKLFGIQLNDGFTRLAAEDGMMFGSVHPGIALEIMWQLRQNNFKGHLYFDTFPQRTDPVKEAEYNIQRVKQFWRAAKMIDSKKIEQIMNEHDAIGALKTVENSFKP